LADSCHSDDGGIRSSETSVPTRATWQHIPEDGILQEHNGFVVMIVTCEEAVAFVITKKRGKLFEEVAAKENIRLYGTLLDA
jgi:hypothetical protein